MKQHVCVAASDSSALAGAPQPVAAGCPARRVRPADAAGAQARRAVRQERRQAARCRRAQGGARVARDAAGRRDSAARGAVRRRRRLRPRRRRAAKMSPADVKAYPARVRSTTSDVRTLFLQFEATDWEQELAAFNNTDVEVPGDGSPSTARPIKDVGVHFRGMSSYFMVPEGRKRSLNVSFDFVDDEADARRIQDAEPAQRQRRPDVPARRALHARSRRTTSRRRR